ncbi:hypothetical protein [Myxococcus phage Mx1]|nr:hypothetical protein [Myxococcus phage Mx1]
MKSLIQWWKRWTKTEPSTPTKTNSIVSLTLVVYVVSRKWIIGEHRYIELVPHGQGTRCRFAGSPKFCVSRQAYDNIHVGHLFRLNGVYVENE